MANNLGVISMKALILAMSMLPLMAVAGQKIDEQIKLMLFVR